MVETLPSFPKLICKKTGGWLVTHLDYGRHLGLKAVLTVIRPVLISDLGPYCSVVTGQPQHHANASSCYAKQFREDRQVEILTNYGLLQNT